MVVVGARVLVVVIGARVLVVVIGARVLVVVTVRKLGQLYSMLISLTSVSLKPSR